MVIFWDSWEQYLLQISRKPRARPWKPCSRPWKLSPRPIKTEFRVTLKSFGVWPSDLDNRISKLCTYILETVRPPIGNRAPARWKPCSRPCKLSPRSVWSKFHFSLKSLWELNLKIMSLIYILETVCPPMETACPPVGNRETAYFTSNMTCILFLMQYDKVCNIFCFCSVIYFSFLKTCVFEKCSNARKSHENSTI